jgi:hypothetical protein
VWSPEHSAIRSSALGADLENVEADELTEQAADLGDKLVLVELDETI